MTTKKVLKTRNYKAGYVVRTELIDGEEFGCPDFEMKSAYTPTGDYIGNSKWGYRLCKKRGIRPEKARPDHNVCSIGFCEEKQKWYGWSHRAIYGFGVGDKVTSEDHLCAHSGWIDEYLEEHPEEDLRLPVGFEAKNLDDCKRMAVSFAGAVS